jgi:CDP-glycerol glycerophosphotransferase
VLLAPDEETAEFLRESFRWQGEVLVAGSPHTDQLVTGDRATARTALRQRLGLPVSTVVLHAPAARDPHDVARVEGRTGLDVAALARELGPAYTVLWRGEAGDRRPAPDLTGVVDVSRYDDLGGLLLACDVAVLDYSGLRFDWALTGRPAIFHVPDLERWSEGRTTAVAREESSPGPRVHTVAGVATCVRDAASLEAAYADQVTAFNARFNALNDGRATARVVAALLG